MPRLNSSILAIFASCAAAAALAQSPDTFEARLSWVPISLAEQRLVGGEGEATATLSRGRLSITGRFSGLPAAATAARLHQGAATGASGPAIADLTISAGRDGTFSGDIELDRAQRAALIAGQLYIQIYADPGVPPDNSVLRGWLLGYADTTATSGRRN